MKFHSELSVFVFYDSSPNHWMCISLVYEFKIFNRNLFDFTSNHTFFPTEKNVSIHLTFLELITSLNQLTDHFDCIFFIFLQWNGFVALFKWASATFSAHCKNETVVPTENCQFLFEFECNSFSLAEINYSYNLKWANVLEAVHLTIRCDEWKIYYTHAI